MTVAAVDRFVFDFFSTVRAFFSFRFGKRIVHFASPFCIWLFVLRFAGEGGRIGLGRLLIQAKYPYHLGI